MSRPFSYLITILFLSILFSCQKEISQKPNDFKELFHLLRSPVDSVRYKALEELNNYELQFPEEGLVLLDSSVHTFLKGEYSFEDISAAMVSKAAELPSQAHILKVESLFPQMNTASRKEALTFLAGYNQPASVETYMRLLAIEQDSLDFLPQGKALEDPANMHLVFPKVLEYLKKEKMGSSILHFTLTCLEEKLIQPDMIRSYEDHFIKESIRLRTSMRKIPAKKEVNWIWDNPDYMVFRFEEGIILDLLGFFNDEKSRAELKESLLTNDPEIMLFAVLSLLQQEQQVDPLIIEKLSASSEVRNRFYEGLLGLGKENLYPSKYKTQEAFAESNMVNWLTYPTELARLPDQIELMKVISVDTETNGIVDYYIFRFKTNSEPFNKDGWMAGISGAFARLEQPTTSGLGSTFSTFEKWESKTPEEHLGNIEGLILEAKEKNISK